MENRAPISFSLISMILTLISSSAEEYVLMFPLMVLGISLVLTLIYTLIGVFMTYSSIRKIDIASELKPK